MWAFRLLVCFAPVCVGLSIVHDAAPSRQNALVVSSVNQTHAASPAANTDAKNVHLAAAKAHNGAVTLPLALGMVADQCKCKFTGLCTCGGAVEFMNCINDACASGTCDCKAAEFFTSCTSMAATCPNVGLTCSAETSTCLHAPVPINMTQADIVEKLQSMKVRKCVLEGASLQGYVNAGIRLKALLPEIQSHLDMLRMKGGTEAVYMGCAPAPKGEEGKDWTASWEAGEALSLPSHTPIQQKFVPEHQYTKTTESLLSVHQHGGVAPVVSATPAEAPKPAETGRRGMLFASILCHVVFILLVAFVYDRVRNSTVYAQPSASEAEASWLHCGSSDPNAFKFGLFGCFGDWKICCLTFWCFQVRWADTMDKANTPDSVEGAEAPGGETGSVEAAQPNAKMGETISYGHGVLLLLALWLMGQFVGLAGFNVYLCTAVFLATLFVLVRYRQKLRTRYMLSAGTLKTYAEDVAAYLCCPCCAAVQEARHVESGMNSAIKQADDMKQQQPEEQPEQQPEVQP